ncbi:MAG TPA: glycosyltransferase, partial [Chryseosolibacter sp.]
MEWIIAIFYTLSLFYLFLFSIGQLHLTHIYLKRKNDTALAYPTDFQPFITIQLPVYNEKYVVERLIEAVVKIDYPREKLEIQILDDSTDETSGIIYQKLEWLQRLELDIVHIRRKKRTGYKAGALQEALKTAKGEFIVIFDSDFIPEENFLKKTIPYFQDPQVGVVQTRWGHINKDYSLITR